MFSRKTLVPEGPNVLFVHGEQNLVLRNFSTWGQIYSKQTLVPWVQNLLQML